MQAYLARPLLALALAPLLITGVYRILDSIPERPRKVRKVGERVLILGATSGIGRSLARQYAERGARVCIVGRRDTLVREVEVECRCARPVINNEDDVLAISADFTSPDDMIKMRGILDQST